MTVCLCVSGRGFGDCLYETVVRLRAMWNFNFALWCITSQFILQYQVRIRELYQRAMYREAIDVVVEAAAVAEDHYGGHESMPSCQDVIAF